jgi:hypothetical protein
MTFRSLLRTCLAVVCLLVTIASLSAQTSGTGALTGTVTDPSGAAVPNVTVTATSTETGQARTTMTSGDGTYKFGLLSPGTYRVQFEATGFTTVAIPSVTVTVTETANLDRRLEVGGQTQAITVQGEEADTVQTTSATVGTVLAGNSISELPLTTRNYTNLLGLSAGANVGVYNATTLGRGTQDIAVNGSSTQQNNFQMDGVSIDISQNNGTGVDSGGNPGIGIANPDAIQEFKIQTSLFDAGYGRNPGANVNVVTKSGTNEFHGTAFEFFRNTVLNANDFFRNQSPPVNGVANNSRQVLNSNQFGGVIGGPVKKDKLFFFTSYQESRQINGLASAGYQVPFLLPILPGGDRSNTAALRASVGATFCPGGTDGGKTSVGGTQVACDGSNINPVAINLLQLKNPDGTYVIPNSGPITGNGTTTVGQLTTYSIPAHFAEHQGIGNFDYVINSKNTLSGRYFYSVDPTFVPFSCGQSAGSAPGTCYPDTADNNAYTAENAVVKLTTIVTNNFVNEARVSFQRDIASLDPDVPFTDTQVGITPIVSTVNNLDNVVVSGLFTIGTNYVTLDHKWISQWEAADQVSWTHGKQTVRAGFEFERDRLNWNITGDSIATLTFTTFQDFLVGLPGCVSTPCPAGTNGSASSNIANSGQFATAGGPSGVTNAFRSSSMDGFVQDDIKVNHRLTVNVGVRWELNGLISSKYGNLTNVWPNIINTVPIPGSTPATGTLAGFVVPSNYNPAINPVPPVGGVFQSNHTIGTQNSPPLDDFAPRVGFAWQPTNIDRFVVRGGFGYFYDRLGDGSYATGYIIAQPYAPLVGNSGAANYLSSFSQPVISTAPTWQDRWVNFATGASSNLPFYAQAPTYLTPLTYEWNLNTQYEFRPTWVLEVGYVGSRGIHQKVSDTQLINEAQIVGAGSGSTGTGESFVAPGIAAGLVTTNTVANASLRVPYLGFSPTSLFFSATDGDDKFNSLQATVRKQLSHGLSLQTAYTWSKSLTTGGLNSNDPLNYGQQYGPNPSYHPQRLAISYSWDLPSGHREGLTGKLINGWTWSGVTIAQDGTPLTPTDTRGGTIYGMGAASNDVSRAQYCPGMGAGNAGTAGSDVQRLGTNGSVGWFNKAAFCAPPVSPFASDGKATGFGDSSLGILLGPGQFNWDMSLVKITRVGGIRENATLQFRTEFFNTFNHPQFSNPAVVDASKGTFGQITSTSVNPRLIQFALKYAF